MNKITRTNVVKSERINEEDNHTVQNNPLNKVAINRKHQKTSRTI